MCLIGARPFLFVRHATFPPDRSFTLLSAGTQSAPCANVSAAPNIACGRPYTARLKKESQLIARPSFLPPFAIPLKGGTSLSPVDTADRCPTVLSRGNPLFFPFPAFSPFILKWDRVIQVPAPFSTMSSAPDWFTGVWACDVAVRVVPPFSSDCICLIEFFSTRDLGDGTVFSLSRAYPIGPPSFRFLGFAADRPRPVPYESSVTPPPGVIL